MNARGGPTRSAWPGVPSPRRALVVVANATRAGLYVRNEEGDALLSVTALAAPLSWLRGGRQGSDGNGKGKGAGPSGVGRRPDAPAAAHAQFARRLGERIEQALVDEHCDQLALFARAPFLGDLTEQLGPGGRGALRAAVDLDLSTVPPHELQTRVGHEMSSHVTAR